MVINLEEAIINKAIRENMIQKDEIYYYGNLMTQGVVQKLIDDAAWNSLLISNVISNLDFETMFKLSKVYKLQSLGVESTIQKIVEILSSRESIDKNKLKGTLILLKRAFNELASQEDYLIRNYEIVLSEIKGSS